ncbi:hypothetical protein [Acinetobacter sp. YH12239]|uniref:hypothetical protein n=1 Tax=Acinetobacter sp. YH12239 TaxID=2601166 RepID=UPI0015D37E65|nr:hypothetical protein [Acinetobacter sp. YH12239]
MHNSLESFLKRISFFLIYLPALIYGCQIAYFSGISEPLGIDISSLGMNYFEVSFFGYLNLSTTFLDNLNKLVLLIAFSILYLAIAFLLHVLAIHPSEKENEKFRVDALLSSFEFQKPIIYSKFVKMVNSFWFTTTIYFFIFIFSLLLILTFYNKGKKDIISTVDKIKTSEICEYTTGYIKQNNEQFRVKPILCGNYKCYGINLDRLEVITYLPENYSQFLNVPNKFK